MVFPLKTIEWNEFYKNLVGLLRKMECFSFLKLRKKIDSGISL